jgi:indolepyruvate ferredoxin oxidoreductase beta subunit
MQIVINGVGGQGVLFLSKILLKTALNQGIKVLASETIGMAQRGGSVISFLKIGKQYKSPMIIPGNADILICLKKEELRNSKGYLKRKGRIYVNSDKYFNATEFAIKNKTPSMANIIFLGYLLKDEKFPFRLSDIEPILPKNTEHLIMAGYNSV